LIYPVLKAGAVLFNAGCIEQVFSLNLEKKKLAQSVLSFSRKTHKTHALIPKNDVIEPKAMLKPSQRPAKSYTVLQTVRHRYNIYAGSCVVLAL